MKTIWSVMKFIYGAIIIVSLIGSAMFAVWVVDPAMEKVTHKLRKEI